MTREGSAVSVLPLDRALFSPVEATALILHLMITQAQDAEWIPFWARLGSLADMAQPPLLQIVGYSFLKIDGCTDFIFVLWQAKIASNLNSLMDQGVSLAGSRSRELDLRDGRTQVHGRRGRSFFRYQP
jgi:hypothetical protein